MAKSPMQITTIVYIVAELTDSRVKNLGQIPTTDNKNILLVIELVVIQV